jgi:hypothetical protein
MTAKLNPIPQKLPKPIEEDNELKDYFDNFNRSVYQMWFALNGNKQPALISTTENIDAKTTGATELFKIPNDKDFIPLEIIIRVTDFTAGSKSTQAVSSFGGNSSTYDDFLNSRTYTISAVDKFLIDKPSNSSELSIQGSGKSFNIIIETGSNATTEKWAVDLIGYMV